MFYKFTSSEINFSSTSQQNLEHCKLSKVLLLVEQHYLKQTHTIFQNQFFFNVCSNSKADITVKKIN